MAIANHRQSSAGKMHRSYVRLFFKSHSPVFIMEIITDLIDEKTPVKKGTWSSEAPTGRLQEGAPVPDGV